MVAETVLIEEDESGSLELVDRLSDVVVAEVNVDWMGVEVVVENSVVEDIDVEVTKISHKLPE